MWEWIADNKNWILSGLGVAIMGVIARLVWWLFVRRRRKDACPASHIALAQTGDQSPVAQIVNAGSVVVDQRQGMSEKVANGLVDIALANARISEENRGLRQETTELRRDLTAAIRRADDAEKRGFPGAGGIIEALRESGDTGRLLEFLTKHRGKIESLRQRATEELLAVNREIAAVAYLRGDIAVAEAAVEEILRSNPDDLDALNRRGRILALRGELAEAETALRRVLDLAVSRKDAPAEAVALGNIGILHHKRGNISRAEELLCQSLQINRKLGRTDDMAANYGNLGILYATGGDLDKAEGMFRESFRISEQLGWREGMANAYGNLGNLCRIRGDLDMSEEMHRRALRIEEQLGRKEGMAAACLNLGNLHAGRRELDKAREYWTKARDLYREIGMPHMVAKVQGWLDELPPAK